MKTKYILVVSAILMLTIVGIASAAPPPPVPQELGRTDTQFPNVTVTTCRGCHAGQVTAMKPHPAANIHHYMLPGNGRPGNTTLGCYDCHPNELQPDGTYAMFIEEECKACHSGTAWSRNSVVNLTVIRGSPGRPHHNTTKASSSNFAFSAAYAAIDRNCKVCHGDSLLDNYNDGHVVKYLSPQAVSVFADFKVNSTISGNVEWGGCAACHDSAAANPILNSNHDTHHYETTSMLGRQCNYCHVGAGSRAEPVPDRSPEPSANVFRLWFNDSSNPYYDDAQFFGWDTSQRHIEVNNRTLYLAGDIVNGSGCTKCHSYKDLHNIEGAGPNPNAQFNIDNNIPGYGHIGNSTDCNGCHANGGVLADQRPIIAPLSIGLESVTPANWVAGVDTVVTLAGENFNQSPTYSTTVLVDGQPVTINSLLDKEITATVPGTTAPGTHTIQVDVGGVTGPLYTFTVAAPVSITSATLTSGVLTITGTSFGDPQQIVTITKANGKVVGSDSITSWTDTQIVATSSAAAVGDNVTVTTATGSATATIQAGEVPDSVTVTVPNGGESWKKGTTKTITWTTAGSSQAANVKIELLKGGSVDREIASSTPNDGSHDWAIPYNQALGNDYTIKVTSVGHTPEYSDTSDATFTISAT